MQISKVAKFPLWSVCLSIQMKTFLYRLPVGLVSAFLHYWSIQGFTDGCIDILWNTIWWICHTTFMISLSIGTSATISNICPHIEYQVLYLSLPLTCGRFSWFVVISITSLWRNIVTSPKRIALSHWRVDSSVPRPDWSSAGCQVCQSQLFSYF